MLTRVAGNRCADRQGAAEVKPRKNRDAYSPESQEAQQFRQRLLDAGYSEGRDVVIDWRSRHT